MTAPTSPPLLTTLYAEWLAYDREGRPPPTNLDVLPFTRDQTQDLIIGSLENTIIRLAEKTSEHVRHLVVFGNCTLQGPEKSVQKSSLPVFFCDRIYVMGLLTVWNVNVTIKEAIIATTKELFEKAIFSLNTSSTQIAPCVHKKNQNRIFPPLLPPSFVVTTNPDLIDLTTLTVLMKTAATSHLELLQFLLLVRANPNAKGSENQTALHVAALHNNALGIHLLLDAKASIDAIDRYGKTPLITGALNGKEEACVSLIKAKANLNLKDAFERSPLSAALYSSNHKVLNLLLSLGMNIDDLPPDSRERMPLRFLCEIMNGQIDQMSDFLRKGGDIETKNANGETSLVLAAKHGHLELVNFLIERGANVVASPHNGSALSWAIRNGHAQVVQRLLRIEATTYTIPWVQQFTMAVLNDHKEVIKIIVEANLQQAQNTLIHSIESNDVEWVETLLIAGVNPDHPVSHELPLYCAATQNNKKMMQILLSHNANGPLALLEAFRRGNIEVIQLFIEVGVTLSFTCPDSQALLNYYALKNDLSNAEQLIAERINLNKKDPQGKTHLMYAIMPGSTSIAELLIHAKADLETQDDHGYTPLIHAITQGKASIVTMLLKHGARLNQGNLSNLLSPLMYARLALAEMEQVEAPYQKEYIEKFKEIILILQDAVAPVPTRPRPVTTAKGLSIQWSADLPSKASISFEELCTAKTIPTLCEAFQRLTHQLSKTQRGYTSYEEEMFESSLKNSFIQANLMNPHVMQALEENRQMHRRFS